MNRRPPFRPSAVCLALGVFILGLPSFRVAAAGGGDGPPLVPLADVDADADGLPDWWEIFWFGNLAQTAAGDPDGDGLTNRAEHDYSVALDPSSPDTDGDRLPDGWEIDFGLDPLAGGFTEDGFWGDPDGDLLINIEEFYGADGSRLSDVNGTGDETDPNDPDTDDDGLTDWEEAASLAGGASAVDSWTPFLRRSGLIRSAAGAAIPDPAPVPATTLPPGVSASYYRRDLLTRDWTVECWVRPDAADLSGDLMSYAIPILKSGALVKRFAYRLSLAANVPSIGFHTVGNTFYQVAGPPLAPGQWTHLAGVWDHNADQLLLHVNGVAYTNIVGSECLSFYGLMYGLYSTNPPPVGASADASFAGRLYLDELRYWDRPRTAGDLAAWRNRFVSADAPGLLAYFRFDDGGTSAEDLTRLRPNGLAGAASPKYGYANHAYGLSTNGFAFSAAAFAPVWMDEELGGLQAVLNPAAARTAARWRVDGGDWLPSGVEAPDLTPTDHQVEYGPAPGWVAPPPDTVTIAAGETLVVTGLYAAATAWLQVVIQPDAATNAGARWRVDGGAWTNGGAILGVRGHTNHVVSFKDALPWVKPADTNVFTAADTTTVVRAEYAALAVTGLVNSASVWSNTAPWCAPPGDGSGSGRIVVAVWPSGVSETNPPSASAVAASTPGLPFGSGTNAFAISPVGPGSYGLAAWIDGNGDGRYQPGEPRSPRKTVAVAGSRVGAGQVTVADDSDGDGLEDWWEAHWFGDLAKTRGGDADGDGLTTGQEYDLAFGDTNGTLRLLNPADWDTDGDLVDDGWETARRAAGAGLAATVADAGADADGDGLSNGQEYRGVDGEPVREADPAAAPGAGRANPRDTGDALDPLNVDTDGDGLIDSFEAAWFDPAGGISPRLAGAAGSDADADGLTAWREQCLLPALAAGGTNDIWTTGPAGLPAADPLTGIRAFSPALDLGAAGSLTITGALAAVRGAYWTDPTDGTGYREEANEGRDTDGDALPDGWEVEFGLDPRNGAGAEGFSGDPDGDGLWNAEEYYGQDGQRGDALPLVNGTGDETSPRRHDDLGTARPNLSLGASAGADTDDDGLADGAEVLSAGTSPVHSMSPFVRRAALIASAGGLVVPDPWGGTNGFRPDLLSRDWTLECRVKVLGAGCTGDLIGNRDGATAGFSYRLSLSNNVPEVGFETLGGRAYRVSGQAVPLGRWVYLAGVWDPLANSLSLYVDGVSVQRRQVAEESRSYDHERDGSGSGREPRLGESRDGSFAGRLLLDEVRIWDRVRTEAELDAARHWLLPGDEPGLLAYYRFDDGGAWAEDFTRRAASSLAGAAPASYFWGEHGYGIETNGGCAWSADAAPVLGMDERGADDTDGDGLPDGWELVNHLDPASALGADGGDGDPDADGLENRYEFRAGTNPRADASEAGVFDLYADPDGDLLVNAVEQAAGSRPDEANTDDDGWTDGEEWLDGYDPVDPGVPAVSRALACGGGYADVPLAFAQRLPAWTLEAWVRPTNAWNGAGTVARRVVQQAAGGAQAVNYELGIAQAGGAWRPYAGYVTAAGATNRLYGPAMPAGAWAHVAASYNPLTYGMAIYTNGAPAAQTNALFSLPPVNGRGGETFLRLGEGVRGLVDEVRVWGTVRTASEIADRYDQYVSADAAGLVHDFRFDDGGETAQDYTHPRDWEQQWIHAATLAGSAAFTGPGAGAIAPPALAVWIDPPEAASGGARWRVTLDADWSAWLESGRTAGPLAEGGHAVEYLAVPGWVTPDPDAVTVSGPGLIVRTGRYERVSGIVAVIAPAAAGAAGAAWRVDAGAWTNSGALVAAAPGPHTAQFGDLAGWVTPAAQSVVVSNGQQVAVTGTYYQVEVMGAAGTLPGLFNRPRSVAFDSRRRLYVADSDNHRVQRFDPASGAWTVWGSRGSAAGQFNQPFGLALDAGDNLYVADANNNRVQRRSAATGSWTVWGGPLEGTGQGQFNGPFDLAVDAAGNVYVADHYNHRVQKRTTAGAWSTLVGNGFADGQVRTPRGIAVDDAGDLYVTDYDPNTGTRVQKFSGGGVFRGRIGGSGAGQGALARSRGLDPAGPWPIYLADTDNSRLARSAAPLAWTTVLGSGALSLPEDVAVDLRGRIVVADTGNHRLVWLNGADAPALAAEAMTMTAAGLTIEWQGRAGWIYAVQYADDLRSPAWTPVPGAGTIYGVNGLMSATDPGAATAPQRFYRVVAY